MAKKRGNGEGSISKRKDGRWWGRYTVHTDKGPKQKAVYGKTRAEVATKLRKAMFDRDSGLVFSAGTLTLGEYLDAWLGNCVQPLVDQGKMEHSTYIRHAGIVRNHLKSALGYRKLRDLSRIEVRSFYNQKGKELAPKSVDHIHTTLQKALGQAVKDDLVPRNVATGERPRSSRNRDEAKALSPAQVKVLLMAAHGTRKRSPLRHGRPHRAPAGRVAGAQVDRR